MLISWKCGVLVVFLLSISSQLVLAAIIVRSVTNSRFNQHVSVGDKVSLNCELTDAYGSQIKWRKVEGRLTDDSSDYAGVLTLYSVRKEDNGEYECFVRNNPSMRSRARLTVLSARSSRFSPEIEANEGSQVEIHCEIKNEPDLKWRKLDGEISKYKTEYGAPDNRLLVYYLTEQDEGDYECYLPNGETSRVKLHIIKNIDNTHSHNYGSYEQPGYEGYNSNNNQQDERNSQQQPEETSYDNNDRERYDDPYQRSQDPYQRPEDPYQRSEDPYQRPDDPYQRSNENSNNNYNQPREENRYDGQPEASQSVERDVGSDAQLECNLPTRDYNQIKWRRIGGALSLYARPNENKLQIDYLELSDSGVYECYLSNDPRGGGATSRVTLRVREIEQDEFGTNSNYYSREEDYKLPAEASGESRIDKSRSENVEIACGLTSNYQLVRWRKLNGEMEENVRVYQNILYIGDLRDSNAGYYECYLENEPSRTSRFALNILPYPTSAGATQYYETTTNEQTSTSTQPPSYDADYNQISENSGEDEPENNDIQASLDPASLVVREGESGEISCTAFTSRQSIDIEWYNDKDELIKQGASDVSFSSRLTKYQPLTISSVLRIKSAKPEYAGRYECRVTSLDQSKSIHFDVRVSDDAEETRTEPTTHEPEPRHEDRNPYDDRDQNREQDDRHHSDDHYPSSTDHYHPGYPNVEVEQPRRPCEYYEATCRNGQCISKSGLCDGRRDCDDGSDEDTCGPVSTNICQPNERVCSRTSKCVQKIWWCDGEPDCDDGEDERSCSPSRPGEACKSTEFSCGNRRQCISKSFLCDKEKDCQDSSDEIGCEPPRILKPPARNLTVRIGGTFRIECHATGFPSPFINWRLNWGHVCDEPRCYATNEQGKGVFTVTDVRYSDAGAYSCEAINNMGRTFAVPDCIVSIQPGPTPPTTRTTTTTTTRRTTTNIPQPQVSDCAIMCHNHTDMCTCSGQCLNCQHNTWGTKCEKCLPGFVGDATRGTPYDCRRVGEIMELQRPTSFMPPAPQPVPELDASQSCRDMCHNHSDNCTCSFCFNCQHNTKGKKCDQCADGYVGDATRGTPYDCVRIGQNVEPVAEITPRPHIPSPPPPAPMNQCDPMGTLRTERDGRCKCKANVNGRFCEHCKPYSFDLERVSPYGCHRCFCNGLNVDCRSSDLSYSKLVADLEQDIQDWKISDKYLSRRESLEAVESKIEFTQFDEFDSKDLFFLVPSKFKGNKIGSYGGVLSFKIYFETSEQDSQGLKPLEIRIAGNNVNLFYIHPDELIPDTENLISVELYENEFLRYGDNRTVNRDHMMMMLANIDTIMIRASYSASQKLVRLYDFELEYASEESSNDQSGEAARQAKSVEVCSCPAGYSGTSCETCDSGYRRARAGFYLGLCERG